MVPPAWLGGVLDGVVDKIGERLADQFAVALDGRRRRLDAQRKPLVVGQRLVEFAHVVGDFGGVEFGHAVARLARFGARDHQQRVEGADQFVGFLDRRLQRRAIAGLVLGGSQRLLAAVAQPRQRRPQIVRDVVGHFLQAAHQRLDALQHGVEVERQPVEFVARPGDRAAGRKDRRP